MKPNVSMHQKKKKKNQPVSQIQSEANLDRSPERDG
jgi:hypothetical protein